MRVGYKSLMFGIWIFLIYGVYLLGDIQPFPEADSVSDIKKDSLEGIGNEVHNSMEGVKEGLGRVSSKVKDGVRTTQDAAVHLKDKGKEKIKGLRQLLRDWMGDDEQWIIGMSSLGWQDTGHSYLTVLEAPGIPASDLSVHYSPREHCITIKGNYTLALGDFQSSYDIQEIVRLPYDVFSEDTAQKIQAIWKDGLVILQVPYQGRKSDVNIPVKSGIPLTEKLRNML